MDFNTLTEDAAKFVLSLIDPETGGFIFARGNQPTLMGTAYAILGLEFTGHLDDLSSEEKEAAVQFLMKGCKSDGSFRDALFNLSMIANEEHDEAYFAGETTCFCQQALDALGAPAPPPREFPKNLHTPEGVRAEFDFYDWRKSHLNSNRVMFWLAQYIHEIEKHRRTDLLPLVDAGLDWIDENQDPETGLWGGPYGVSLSAALAATFHYTFFYYYWNRPLLYVNRIIDSCIELQREDGLFSRNNDVGQTCLDYDALDLLAKCALVTDYRKPDIQAVFQRADEALLALRNEDGGFANCKRRWAGRGLMEFSAPYHTGLKICLCDTAESNSFSTWFRLLAIRLCRQEDWVDDPATAPVTFRRLPWLGYHDVTAVRNAHKGNDPKPIRVTLSKIGKGVLFQNKRIEAKLKETANSLQLKLPNSTRHIALKLDLKSATDLKIKLSYKTSDCPYYVDSHSLSQNTLAGDNFVYFLVGDEEMGREVLIEFIGENLETKIKNMGITILEANAA